MTERAAAIQMTGVGIDGIGIVKLKARHGVMLSLRERPGAF